MVKRIKSHKNYAFRTYSGKFKKINKMNKAMISTTGLSTKKKLLSYMAAC